MKGFISKGWIKILMVPAMGALALSMLLHNPRPVPAKAVTFSDMGGHWAEEKVALLGYKKIIDDSSNFKPEKTISRIEFVKLLVLASGSTKQPEGQKLPRFKDIPVEHWAWAVTEAAYARGLVQGHEGAFYPDLPIKRVEAAVLLARALNPGETGTIINQGLLPYKDYALIPPWAAAGVQMAYQKGVMKGFPDGSFRPSGLLTRAEAAAMICNLLDATGLSYKYYGQLLEKSPIEIKVRVGAADLEIPVGHDLQVLVMGRPAAIDQLGEGKPVKVILDEEGKVGFLAQQDEAWVETAVYGHEISQKLKVPVLMYHHLALPGQYAKKNSLVVTPQSFERQLKGLSEAGYNTITMEQLRKAVTEGGPLPVKPVVITFDDGYESNYVYAYPLLQKYNCKATINIVVKSTEEAVANSVYGTAGPGFDARQQTHLTWTQMKEMVDSGLVEIQSHTYNSHNPIVIDAKGHQGKALVSRKYLTDQNRVETVDEYKARIYEDLAKAKTEIEQNLGVKVTVIAYPYGAYNEFVKQTALDLGYQTAVTIKPGYNGLADDPMTFRRINVNPTDSLEVFLHKLVGDIS